MFSYAIMNVVKNPGRSLQVFGGTVLVLLLLFGASSFQTGMDRSLSVSGDEKNVILLGSGSEESLERSEVSWKAVSAARGIQGLLEHFGKPVLSRLRIGAAEIDPAPHRIRRLGHDIGPEADGVVPHGVSAPGCSG